MEYRLDKIIGDFAASLEDRRGFRPVLRELIAAYARSRQRLRTTAV
jgi:hypothetical protein